GGSCTSGGTEDARAASTLFGEWCSAISVSSAPAEGLTPVSSGSPFPLAEALRRALCPGGSKMCGCVHTSASATGNQRRQIFPKPEL
ncbi:hypothetical protein LEMLEM_LOCUS18158, partial [Lemmus lemmus]